MRRRRRAFVIAIAAAAAILVAGRALSATYVDYLWYAEMHAEAVWRARLVNLFLLTGTTAAAITAFVFANLYAVRRSIVAVVLPRRMGNLEIGEEVPGRYLTALAAASSVVLGLLLSLPPEPWVELAAARYGVPFGETDPYFQADLGFYVYWLPLENALYVRALLVLLVTVCVVVVLYFAVTPSLRWDRSRFRVTAHVRRHAAALTPCFFAVVAWMYRLDAYSVLSHGAGPNGAFTYIDHHFTIPADRVLALVTLAAGLVAGFALWRGQIRTTLGVLTASLLLPLVVFQFVPPLLRHYADRNDAARRERPYAVIRTQATRAAYGVAGLGVLGAGAAGRSSRFASLSEAGAGVAIWDPAALAQALERGGHRTNLADAVGWRPAPGGLLALAIDRGETPVSETTPIGAAPGQVLPVRATVADDHGGPVRTDLQGRAGPDGMATPAVLVYDGAVGRQIVADSLDVIAAPRVAGFGARLAQAWSEQWLGLLTADLPEPHPKIVTRRDVRDRVRALAPFFAQGSTVWPVLDADSLYWVVDLYSSVSDTYPLSQHFSLVHEERSYFQHAATAFVQAYTGRITIAADSSRDSIAETWVRRFPDQFVSWRSLPLSLATWTPPATDAALATAAAFGASGGGRAAPLAGEPLPTVLHVPSTENADTLLASGQPPCVAPPAAASACTWAVPLVDPTDHVTAVVVAIGGVHRALVWTPVDSTGPRWPSALERLQRAADSAVPRHDGAVARGRVRVVLVGDRVALVQPEYAWRPDVAPTLLAVTVMVGDTAFAGVSLAEAVGLSDTAASGARRSGAPGRTLSTDFRARVAAVYDAMQAALRRGDLAGFGAAYADLGRLLGRPAGQRPTLPPPR